MKISITDECQGKFSNILKDHWQGQGHEVIFDKYFDPKKILWADVCFFDWGGNNIQRASYPEDAFWKEISQPQNKNVILRTHDIDLWAGSTQRVNFNWVNNLVFVGPHLMDRFLPELKLTEKTKVHFIKHGIDTNKFTFQIRQPGHNIAWIGNINEAKNLQLALYVMAELPRYYTLHVVGKGLSSWKKYYVENYIKDTGINVQFSEYVENVNDFLEDKNYLLNTSGKEAFGFVIGESCAKGIKPIIHNFWGSSNVWPVGWTWNTVQDAVRMITNPNIYNSKKYKNYIEQNYPFQKMLDEYNNIINN